MEAARKVQKISKEYVELYKNLAKQFEKYKEFIIYELESHEMIREGYEKVIQKKEDHIDDLKEALSVPRQHYKFIDNLQADEIVKQKGEIVREMADNMGVPEEQLLQIMYKAEAARTAKAEVEKAIKDQERAKAEEEENGGGADPSAPQSPSAMSEKPKPKLGADASQQSLDAKPAKKAGDVFSSANKL